MFPRGVRYGDRNALRRHHVHDGSDHAPGRFRAGRRGPWPAFDLPPRAHPHPGFAPHSPADRERRARRGVQAHTGSVRGPGDRRRGHGARPARHGHLPRRPARADRHRQGGGDAGSALGRSLRLRHRLRLERGRARASRRDDAGAPRRRARSHARDAAALARRASRVPRQVRGARAVMVVAEAGEA